VSRRAGQSLSQHTAGRDELKDPESGTTGGTSARKLSQGDSKRRPGVGTGKKLRRGGVTFYVQGPA